MYAKPWKKSLNISELEISSNLFSPRVAFCVAGPEMFDAPLLGPEGHAVQKAVIKRRREFAAGRAVARIALGRFGCPTVQIPQNLDRTPEWPSGYVGSISHCDGFCGAAVARANEISGIGFDAEVAAPLSRGSSAIICSEAEMAGFTGDPALPWSKIAFSAKEAFYKCFFPMFGRQLDFLDVALTFTSLTEFSGSFMVEAVSPFQASAFPWGRQAGRWMVLSGFVFTSFTCEAGCREQ